MAEIPNIVETLRQQPGFDSLPQSTQEQLIMDSLKKAAGGTPRSPALAQEQQAAAQTPWWQRAAGAAAQASPEIGLYAPELPQVEQAVSEMTPQERTAFRTQQGTAEQQAMKSTAAGAISAGASATGAAVGAPWGPGPMVAGEMIGSGIGYGVNVALGLEEPSLLNLGLNVGLPGVWPAVKGVLRPFARSSKTGRTVLRKEAIRDVTEANTALRQAHEAQQSLRQGEIDFLTQVNETAKANHGTLEQALKDQNAAAWKVRDDEIRVRNAEIERLTLDNKQAAAAYESQRLQAIEQRAAEEKINTTARLRHQAVQDAQDARYARTKEANTRLIDRIRRQTRKRAVTARAAQAGNPAIVRTDMDGILQDIPSRDAVDGLYDTLDDTLKAHNISIEVPEYRAAQREIKTWGEGTQKVPRGGEHQVMIQEMTRGLEKNEPFTMREMVNANSFLGNQVRLLRKRASTGAGDSKVVNEELAAVTKLHLAMDDSFLKAAERLPEASEIRAQALDARAAYRARHTYDDLQDFWDDMTDLNPRTGTQVMNPIKGLKNLDSPGYAVLKRFMQQTPIEGSTQSLYDHTVATLQKMVPEQMTVQDRVLWYAELHKTGDPRGKIYDITPPPSREIVSPPIPQRPPLPEAAMTQVPPPVGAVQQPVPEPLQKLDWTEYPNQAMPPKPTPQPVPEKIPALPASAYQEVPSAEVRRGPLATATGVVAHGGMAAGAFLLGRYAPGGIPPYALGGGALAASYGLSKILASTMMTPKGQELLLNLVKARGLRLDPVMTGLLNAAVREGLSYGLPLDDPTPSPRGS